MSVIPTCLHFCLSPREHIPFTWMFILCRWRWGQNSTQGLGYELVKHILRPYHGLLETWIRACSKNKGVHFPSAIWGQAENIWQTSRWAWDIPRHFIFGKGHYSLPSELMHPGLGFRGQLDTERCVSDYSKLVMAEGSSLKHLKSCPASMSLLWSLLLSLN